MLHKIQVFQRGFHNQNDSAKWLWWPGFGFFLKHRLEREPLSICSLKWPALSVSIQFRLWISESETLTCVPRQLIDDEQSFQTRREPEPGRKPLIKRIFRDFLARIICSKYLKGFSNFLKIEKLKSEVLEIENPFD